MPAEFFHHPTFGGYPTPMNAWLPEADPVSVILIVHGMAEHAGRYAPIAEILVTHGYAVFANENRAHGKAVSDQNQPGIGEENWYYKQVEDLRIIIAYLHERFPGTPLFLFGHSMGSFICQRYFELYGDTLQGLILSATNGQQDPLLNIGIALAYTQYKLFGPRFRSGLINQLSFSKFNRKFKPNRTKFDWLSRNETEVDKYINDQNCGYVCSAGFFYYFFKGIRDTFDKKNIAAAPKDVPVYCFAGSDDPVGLEGEGFMKLISNWQEAGIHNITFHLYHNGRHEMLNEINREEVMTDLIQWIRKTQESLQA